MDFNRVVLIGRLGKDPEVKSLPTGMQVVSFSLATNRKQKDQKVTDWHNVTCFAKTAENAAKFLNKGSLALVEGNLQYDAWEKDGVKRTTTKIVASNVLALSSAEKKPEAAPSTSGSDDDFGIPF